MNTKKEVFTVGHSTHRVDDFLNLLQMHKIEAIADVRSSPYSRFNPQFNREVLCRSLAGVGIAYVFMGKELGARRSESNCYEGQQVSYERVAEAPLFREGLDRIVRGAEKMRIAIMCAEKDPLTCHRTILVARNLCPRINRIFHILEDGQLEDHEAAERRLLKELRLENGELFIPTEGRIAEAYSRRAKEIAYVEVQ